MDLTKIEKDWEVFAEEGATGVGAVREVAADHITVYVENFGDVRLTADRIKSAHDGKVILETDGLDDDVRAAVTHAHDAERDV